MTKKTQKPRKNTSETSVSDSSDDEIKQKNKEKKKNYEKMKKDFLNPLSKKYIPGMRQKLDNQHVFYCICQIDYKEYLAKEIQLEKQYEDQEIFDKEQEKLIQEYFKQSKEYTMHNRYSHFSTVEHKKFLEWHNDNEKNIRYLSEGMGKYRQQWMDIDSDTYKNLIRLRLQIKLSHASCFSSFQKMEDLMKIINEPNMQILSQNYNDETFYRQKTKQVLKFTSLYIQNKVQEYLNNNCFSLLEDGTPLNHKNLWLKIGKFFTNEGPMRLLVIDIYDYSQSGTGKALYNLQQQFFDKNGSRIIQFVAEQGTGVAKCNEEKVNKFESSSYAGIIKQNFPKILLTADSLHILNLLERDAEQFLPKDKSNLAAQISKIIRKSPKIRYEFEELYKKITLQDLQIELDQISQYESSNLLRFLNYTEIPQNCSVRWSAAFNVIKSINKYYDVLIQLFESQNYYNKEISDLLHNPETKYVLKFRERVLSIIMKLIKYLQKDENDLLFSDNLESYQEVLYSISKIILKEDYSCQLEIQEFLEIDYSQYESDFEIFAENKLFMNNLYDQLEIDINNLKDELVEYLENINYKGYNFTNYEDEANSQINEILNYSRQYLVSIIQGLLQRTNLQDPVSKNFVCIDPQFASKKSQWKYYLDRFPQILNNIVSQMNDDNNFYPKFSKQLDLWYLNRQTEVIQVRQQYKTLYEFYQNYQGDFDEKYGYVKQIARNILLLKATSKQCESYFSQAKLILQQQRFSLDFSTFKESMIVKLNFSILNLDCPKELQSLYEFFQIQKKIEIKEKQEQNLLKSNSILEANINDEYSKKI